LRHAVSVFTGGLSRNLRALWCSRPDRRRLSTYCPNTTPAYRDLLHHCIANLDAFSCIRLAWLVERRIR
jgi:hypothetical protein